MSVDAQLAGLFVDQSKGPTADHWTNELGGVEMGRLGVFGVLLLTLLYSFMVNVLVEIGFYKISKQPFKSSPVEPPTKVFTKTFVDVIGCVLLKELLLLSNMRCLPPVLRVLLNFSIAAALFASVIFGVTNTMTNQQISDVTSTFLAVWFLARVTEIFHLGTLWAFKVSYGSSLGCNFC